MVSPRWLGKTGSKLTLFFVRPSCVGATSTAKGVGRENSASLTGWVQGGRNVDGGFTSPPSMFSAQTGGIGGGWTGSREGEGGHANGLGEGETGQTKGGCHFCRHVTAYTVVRCRIFLAHVTWVFGDPLPSSALRVIFVPPPIGRIDLFSGKQRGGCQC